MPIQGERDSLFVCVEMTRVQQVCNPKESHCPALDCNWLISMQMFLRHISVSADPRNSSTIFLSMVVCINLKKKLVGAVRLKENIYICDYISKWSQVSCELAHGKGKHKPYLEESSPKAAPRIPT